MGMGKRSIFFVLLLSSAFAFAQQSKIDSLEQLLTKGQSANQKIDLLCDLADHYLAYQPSKAKHYAEEALSLSIETDYVKGEILALSHLSDYEFRQGNYAQAIQLASKSLHQAEAIKDSTLMAMAYRVLGNTNNFGLKRYDSALVYQLKAFRIHEQRKDYTKMAAICGSITWIYATTNQHLDEAHRLVNLGIHLSDSLRNTKFLSYNYNSKGLIFMQEHQLDSALKYFDLSILWALENKDWAVIAFNKELKASIYFEQNKIQEANDLFHIALKESRAINLREVVKNSYAGLAKSYAAIQNYPMAYKYSTLFNELQDSLLNAEITQKALLSELESEEMRSQAKISELQVSNAQAKKEKIIVILSFGITLAFSISIIFLVARNSQQRARTNKLLHEKNKQIEEQNLKLTEVNQTKDKLFSILGHDMRSPMASLKGMLDMVAYKQISSEEFMNFAPKLNQQVTAISETLENLLKWSQSQQQGWVTTLAPIYIHPLIAKCTTLFSEIVQEKKLTLINQVEQGIIVHGDENQLELVFRNLIHNAIKFTNMGGSITVNSQGEGDFVMIRVTDNGIGMSDDQVKQLFTLTSTSNTRGTQGEQGTGLGLHLCFEMVKENGGKIEVSSRLHEGTKFCVYLKTKNS